VSVPGSGDSEYAGTKGIWKDTLFVKGGYTLYVRTRYQRYIGEYVLHCHILFHEDHGMMQLLEIYGDEGPGPTRIPESDMAKAMHASTAQRTASLNCSLEDRPWRI